MVQTAAVETKIIEQKIIETWYDMLRLDVIDWSRPYGMWEHPGETVRAITSCFCKKARYTIIQHDLLGAPDRDDWPGWTHTGDHPSLARLFWNDFHTRFSGTLTFSDEPDFSGTIHVPDSPKPVRFWGDLGRVSPQAFAMVQKKMVQHDLWISVPNHRKQIIIETLVDIQELWSKVLGIE